MSTDLVINTTGLTTSLQPIADQNANSSTLNISKLSGTNAAAAVIAGGGSGATSTLGLATFAPGTTSTANGNMLLQAVDQGNATAILNFLFSQGSSTTKTVFSMKPGGGLQAPSLANLPAAGTYAPLVIDPQGNILVGKITAVLAVST